jgi:hypothetical protein
MQFFFALIPFVALASAYQITSPGGAAGWTTAGPNVVAWQRVSTDALNFTLVLSNQAQTPSYSQVLAALVDGTLGTFTVSPPSTGYPTGNGFQVNFVQDTEHLSTIYAQSTQFAIAQATTTASSLSTATTPFTPTNPVATTTDTSTDTNTDLNPTGSLTNTTAPSKNGADRMAVAGSASLIFGALAAIVL